MIQPKDVFNSTRVAGHVASSQLIMTTPTAAYSDVVTDWNEIAIQTFPPAVLGPTQARFLGIVHAAIYDAINAIDRKHQVYAIDIKAPPGASMEAAAATAAHDTLIKLFPVQQSALDTALAESLVRFLTDRRRETASRLARIPLRRLSRHTPMMVRRRRCNTRPGHRRTLGNRLRRQWHPPLLHNGAR